MIEMIEVVHLAESEETPRIAVCDGRKFEIPENAKAFVMCEECKRIAMKRAESK